MITYKCNIAVSLRLLLQHITSCSLHHDKLHNISSKLVWIPTGKLQNQTQTAVYAFISEANMTCWADATDKPIEQGFFSLP